ncbi:MAG: acyl-CoA dehydratase activase-related protein, partial [Candidatus Zixiibacteriota bacterium]
RRIGNYIFFQGGVAWNKAVVAAFEKLTGKKITVPPHHDVTGAIGAAILAQERAAEPGFITSFKGFDLHKRNYGIETFSCEDCSNQCDIHKVEIEGEEPLYYGARCEKYDIKQRSDRVLPPDYIKLRQKLLFKRYLKFKKPKKLRGRIGIPLVLHFFEYYPFWRAFFEALDYKVVNSDASSQQIAEDALELFIAETCYPIKLVYGHIANLIEKKVDAIFLPALIKVSDEKGESDDGAYICPYVQSIGSAVRTRFDFAQANIRFINPPIRLSSDVVNLRQKLKRLAGDLKLSDREFQRAVDAGLKAYKAYRETIREEGEKILADLAPDEKAMVIVSRPYNGYDRRLSLDLPDKIRNLGYKAIPIDFLQIGDGEAEFPYMYWRYGRKILTAGDYIRRHPNLFAVYISSFGCGPDSFITHFFRKRMSGKPYLQLELDEHSADAGLITRCEAFFDSLRFYQFSMPVSEFSISCDDFKPFEKTIYIPNMCDHAYVLRAAFERYGLTAEVLDEPDETTLEWGKKFTSGKECFPCCITTGDMLKKIKSNGFDPSRAVFFMPGADGPCRFGLYSQYHRMLLDDLGYRQVPIFSPNSQDGYSGFGLEGTDFRKVTWQGLVFLDCLTKLLQHIRPYENNRGETERVYLHYLQRLNHAIINREPFEPLAEEAAEAFAKIDTKDERFPLVGIVGEIYLRNNRFSNNYLIEKLERLGLEVWLASFCEWPMYTSLDYFYDAVKDRELGEIIQSSLQVLTQKRYERKITKAFGRRIKLRHEYPVGKTMKLASRYLPADFKGEAILSVGKAIEMAREGAVGIINAMPFNCMPGTVVSSLSKKLSEDLGGIPWLNISYEGLRDSGEETRLEAFADQVRAFARNASVTAAMVRGQDAKVLTEDK